MSSALHKCIHITHWEKKQQNYTYLTEHRIMYGQPFKFMEFPSSYKNDGRRLEQYEGNNMAHRVLAVK